MSGAVHEGADVLAAATGKRIAALALVNDALRFTFDDGAAISVRDDAQDCCEHRYMTCDDDLSAYVGATLLGLALRGVEARDNEYGDAHDVQFLEVQTSAGQFTAETHNEHNGYYGGFSILVEEVSP